MLPCFLLRVMSGKEMKEESRTDTTPHQSKELRLRVGTVQMQISPDQTLGIAPHFWTWASSDGHISASLCSFCWTSVQDIRNCIVSAMSLRRFLLYLTRMGNDLPVMDPVKTWASTGFGGRLFNEVPVTLRVPEVNISLSRALTFLVGVNGLAARN